MICTAIAYRPPRPSYIGPIGQNVPPVAGNIRIAKSRVDSRLDAARATLKIVFKTNVGPSAAGPVLIAPVLRLLRLRLDRSAADDRNRRQQFRRLNGFGNVRDISGHERTCAILSPRKRG